MLSGDVMPSVLLYPLRNFAAAASGALASSADNCGSSAAASSSAFMFKEYYGFMLHAPLNVFAFTEVWILSNLDISLACRIRCSV